MLVEMMMRSASIAMAVAMAMVVAVAMAVVVVAVMMAVAVAVAILVALQRPAAAVIMPASLLEPHFPAPYCLDRTCLPSVNRKKKTERIIILIRNVDRVPIYSSSTENL